MTPDKILDKLYTVVSGFGYAVTVEEAKGAMEEYAEQIRNDWHSVDNLLPPFGLVVECPNPLKGTYEASLFDNDYHVEPNGGKPRFLLRGNEAEGIQFSYPNLWRFKQ